MRRFLLPSLLVLSGLALRGEVNRVDDSGTLRVGMESSVEQPADRILLESLHTRLRKLEQGWYDETENVIHLQRETGRQLALMDQQDRRQNHILVCVSGFFLLLALVEHIVAYQYLKRIQRKVAGPGPTNPKS